MFFQLATWHTINFAYTRESVAQLQQVYRDAQARRELERLARLVSRRGGHCLALQVEEAKIGLSRNAQAAVSLDRLDEALTHVIDQDAFVAATRPLVERTTACVRALLADACLRNDAIDTIYFTGGASGVPQLRARIAAALPAARCVEGDLHGSIGAGLALVAAQRYG